MSIDFTRGFQFGKFIVEPLKGCVVGDDQQPRHLPPKAMAVLISLAEVAPEPLTRESLIDRVWVERCVSDEVLTHAITELRHALDDSPSNPEYIQTIPKRGYCLLANARPIGESVRPGVGNDRGPAVQRPVSRGFVSIQRNPVSSVLVVGGFVSVLAALYYIHDELDGESLVPSRETGIRVPVQVPSPPGEQHAPEHSEASELLLRAEFLERQATPENTRLAETLLEEAVSIDSTYARAWALLGRVYYRQTGLFRSRPVREGSELARQAIWRALIINPKYGPAHADLALINMTSDFDFDKAQRHLRQAQDLSPTDPQVLRVAAKMEMTHDHVDHAIDLLERWVRLEPHSCMAHMELGQAYYFARRPDDAESELETSLTINPDLVRSRYLLGLTRLVTHSEELALATMAEESDEGLRMAGLALARFAMDDRNSSNEALDRIRHSESKTRHYAVAVAYAFRGQHDDAIDWLELAYEHRDGDLVFLVVDPLLEDLRSTARWKQLIEKLGLPHPV